MRFVRAFSHPDTGQLTHVRAYDLPFAEDDPPIIERVPHPELGHVTTTFVPHELGAAEHFEPFHASLAVPCSPAAHLVQRLEVNPLAAPGAVGLDRFRVKAGHESAVPMIHRVPTTKAGILAMLRARGPQALHVRVAHYLHFMGVLGDHEMDAAGLPHVTLAAAVEFDRVYQSRGGASRLTHFKMQLRHRANERIVRRHQERAQRTRRT